MRPPGFLTEEQLRDLTGYVQGAAQIRWLRKNGVTHFVRADGKPAVAVSALAPSAKPARVEPDFEALTRVNHVRRPPEKQ